MAKFSRKPYEIDAVRVPLVFTPEAFDPAKQPRWLIEAVTDGSLTPHPTLTNRLQLVTARGTVSRVGPGDWIVQLPDGMLDVVPDEEFKVSFEPITEDPADAAA